MASNSFFSGRIPPELHQSVRDYCKESGKSKTKVLIEALSNYLNIPVQDRNNKNSEVTKEMYNSLVIRIENLEKSLANSKVINNDNQVINTDNEDKDKEEVKVILEKNIDKFLREKREKEEKSNQKSTINHEYNNNNLKLDNLTNKELLEISNISNTQLGRLRKLVTEEAKNRGYNIQPNTKFPEHIEAIQKKKKITVKGIDYKLFCVGLNEKSRPLWKLVALDNNSYQLNIMQNSNCQNSD